MRIGIRHRGRQTLYISPLIDPSSRDGLPFGKIWAGLHLALIDDVLQRHSAMEKREEDQRQQRGAVPAQKRKHSGPDSPAPKKQRREVADAGLKDKDKSQKRGAGIAKPQRSTKHSSVDDANGNETPAEIALRKVKEVCVISHRFCPAD